MSQQTSKTRWPGMVSCRTRNPLHRPLVEGVPEEREWTGVLLWWRALGRGECRVYSHGGMQFTRTGRLAPTVLLRDGGEDRVWGKYEDGMLEFGIPGAILEAMRGRAEEGLDVVIPQMADCRVPQSSSGASLCLVVLNGTVMYPCTGVDYGDVRSGQVLKGVVTGWGVSPTNELVRRGWWAYHLEDEVLDKWAEILGSWKEQGIGQRMGILEWRPGKGSTWIDAWLEKGTTRRIVRMKRYGPVKGFRIGEEEEREPVSRRQRWTVAQRYRVGRWCQVCGRLVKDGRVWVHSDCGREWLEVPCDQCGELVEVSGDEYEEVVVEQGRYVCEDCRGPVYYCAGCGERLDEEDVYTHDDDVYCHSCWEDVLGEFQREEERECVVCGSRVTGYTDAEWDENRELCEDCYREAERARHCSRCTRTERGYMDEEWEEGGEICTRCWARDQGILVCESCGLWMRGFDERVWRRWGRRCPECANAYGGVWEGEVERELEQYAGSRRISIRTRSRGGFVPRAPVREYRRASVPPGGNQG